MAGYAPAYGGPELKQSRNGYADEEAIEPVVSRVVDVLIPRQSEFIWPEWRNKVIPAVEPCGEAKQKQTQE